jgi:leucyl/phenylalanyl-tRNA--protein transferase
MNIKKTFNTANFRFPDPWLLPDESDGLIYIGGNLAVETLVNAYTLGIFPWPLEPEYPLFWFCPEPRGVLDFSEIHVPRSLAKLQKKNAYHFTFNKAFNRVMDACADQKRKGQEGTWIVPEMFPAYDRFHKEGYAHSVECWRGDKLVGGLYGVLVKGVFSGESMFHKEPNTSKLCVLAMIERLKAAGFTWMDIQMVTPVMENLGGKYITRKEFLGRLRREHAKFPKEKLSLG